MNSNWKDFEKALDDATSLAKGGPGSGHHGHRGRAGIIGGSEAGEGGGKPEPIMEEGLPKRESQTSRIVDMQRGARDESQRETSNLGGGIGNSYKSDIKDDGRVCYKPDEENGYHYSYGKDGNGLQAKLLPLGETNRYSEAIRRELTDNIPMSAREEAAHKLDRESGLNVTPDMIVGDFGKGRGSALGWVEGTFDIGRGTDGDSNHKDVEKIATLDFLIGNTDRHRGNLIRGEDGRVYAMDNGLAFPNRNRPGEFRSLPLELVGSRYDKKIPKSVKTGISRLTDAKIDKIMKKFPQKERDGVKFRRDRILGSTYYRDLHNEARTWRNRF